MTTDETPRDPLREALNHIAFLRSCVASGEHLSAADLARLDDFQRRAALASSTPDAAHPNRWTTQELIDIYDRTADRPDIRAKIGKWVRA